ncbi:tryptophan-rich sensory protein [Psychroflexus montanilacus]|uniref:tryptophan-rich sensory protein n=1 Tax=Psychroflexus montanilacus TaxID=2873598 RepID=UPI001CCEEFE3|nr:tryptophan-rich sensory protein [Psychroflexus montanilacus]MBZ9651428.1 tryptophan-rich sensory protein [Psychroflexus montanilacus]
MKQTGKDILAGFQKKWQFLLWLEVVLYATGFSVLSWLLTLSWLVSILGFVMVFAVLLILRQPWKIDLLKVSHYIDSQSNQLEYSSGLLLQSTTELSGLAKLQQQKISKAIKAEIKNIQPRHQLKKALFSSIIMIGIGVLVFYSGVTKNLSFNQNTLPKEEQISFKPTDSLAVKIQPPVLNTQEVTIHYPAYTGLRARTTSNMNIEAVEGSRVNWKLSFEGEVDSVSLESMGKGRLLRKTKQGYTGGTVLESSGFYNFRFTDTKGATYTSDLFAIEVTKDKAPVIVLNDLKQFTAFNYNDKKNISFQTSITDDFGIDNAYIIATVSKGTGESVKFREEQLSFDQSITTGKKQVNLTKSLDLEDIAMEPGDELYFYVEARDLKRPLANVSRSETHFAVIKDTTDYGPGVDAGLGVDLMPDYFRSQRQLIIDTKKLISQRGQLSTEEFNSTSNDLGFDQKSLRLKYGQFMGDEAEGGMGSGGELSDDHDHEEDPLADYSHNHDGDNEHNLVEEEHDHDHDHDDTDEEKDPLAEYLHDHGDPESSTLFTDNLKAKLRQALNIMWDAELHLRLHEPEKSLPFQYEALELIQEIKNSARIYVHRIGFDPPPIKEEARLSGDVEEVSNYSKAEDLERTENFYFIKQSILRLEEFKGSNAEPKKSDRQLFEKAGNELADKAIAEPGRYLQTLQQLKRLKDEPQIDQQLMFEVQKGLLEALPKLTPEPMQKSSFNGKLNEFVLKELQRNE